MRTAMTASACTTGTILTALLVWCLVAGASAAQGACRETVVLDVVDATSLRVAGRGGPMRVALYGIEIPGTGRPWEDRARETLRSMVLGRSVTLCPKKTPAGIACEVYVRDGYMVNVNRDLVRRGMARAVDPRYKSLESLARTNRRGFWARETPDTAEVHSAGPVQAPASDTDASAAQGGLSVYRVTQTPGPASPGKGVEAGRARERRRELDMLRAKQQQAAADTEPGLLDIVRVAIRATLQEPGFREDGVVAVSAQYFTAEPAGPVYWTDGDVNCDCRVTGHFNNGTSTRIARSSTVVQSYRERIYISIPSVYLDPDDFIVLNSCTVACGFSAGIFSLEATDKFYVYFTWTPRWHFY